MKSLTLSIVIPAYNEEDHIIPCLESIAAQTIVPDEVIVVDNNSTDRTAMLAEQYGFVKVVKEQRQGIAYARNAGFDSAKYALIGRLDADTVLPETWVEVVLAAYKDKQDFALTGGGYFYNISLPNFNGWMLSQLAFRMNRFIMGHYILWGSNMVMERKVWHRVRHDVCTDNHDIHEDLDLAIHLHELGVPITFRENIRVGVMMKRVYGRDKPAFRRNLNLWPQTLYAHDMKRAWLGRVGAGFLYHGTHLFMLPADTAIKLFKASRRQLRTDP